MRGKITKRSVDDLVASGKPIFLFDTNLPGFVLKVMPSGRKAYQLRYRMGGRNSPLKTFTIGQHGNLSPDQARRLGQSLLGEVRRGIDPAAEKARKAAEDRGAQTIGSLSAVFLEVYGSTKLKPRSLTEYRRAFTHHILPVLGTLKASSVTHGDVERLHHGMRHIPATANRTTAALSKFFSWAIRSGYRPDRQNPCQGLQKFRETPRKRYLSPVEIGALGEAIRDAQAGGIIDVWQAGLIRALLLSGLRRDELRTLQWEDVNEERGVLALRDTKTGARDVPISAPLQELLTSLPGLAGNAFVFCGSRPGRPIVNIAKPWRRLSVLAGLHGVRVHDLRHTAASIGIASGASLALVGGVLGHRNERTTQRYAHLTDDPVRQTSETIASRVAAALDGKPPSDVVPFTPKN